MDGQRVTVPAGTSLLDAAKNLHLDIPTLCHDPRLPPAASCRLCLVEVEGKRQTVPSCATTAEEGWVVHTATPALHDYRRHTLEMLLADHPSDCLSCVKTGDCKLQDYAFTYGADPERFAPRKNRPVACLDTSNPLLAFDWSKCVKCGLCIRACDQLQGQQVLGWFERNHHLHVGFSGATLQEAGCVFCGTCSSVCPVGAITDQSLHTAKVRAWEKESVVTACTYCGTGCELTVFKKGNEVVQVTSDKDSEPNQGLLCVKGRYGFSFLRHPDRLTTPLLREHRSQPFRPVSWDEALAFTTERLAATRARTGVLSSSRGTNEENYLAQKFVRTALGTNHIDNCARVCHAPSVVGLRAVFGSGAATASLADIDKAEVILICGSNTTEAHPVIGARVKRAVRRGARLIVIDPREIEMARSATVWLQPQPGTNVAVINGLMHVILKKNLEDRAFIASRTEGIDLFKEVIKDYTPSHVAGITGIPPARLEEAARLFGETKAGLILYGLGVTEHRDGSHGVIALANLALLTGNVGRPGAGINPLRGQNNVQGSCDMGALPDVWPGYASVRDAKHRLRFETLWHHELVPEPGLKEPQMYDAAVAGTLNNMWIIGYDPARTHSDIRRVREALSSLSFLAVSELFMTDTASFAHVVFPAAASFEKDGTFTNAERRIRRLRKVVEPPGEARADWDVICQVATRLGTPMSYANPSAIMDEIAQAVPSYGGVRYEFFETPEGRHGLQWPIWNPWHHGTPMLHKRTFPIGKGAFHELPYYPPREEETTTKEYPLILITGRRLTHYNNGSMTRRSKDLLRIDPEEHLDIHPETAQSLKIQNGQRVEVVSRWGRVTVPVKLTTQVHPGSLFMGFHFPSVATNELVGNGRDATALTPNYKVTPVRIELVS